MNLKYVQHVRTNNSSKQYMLMTSFFPLCEVIYNTYMYTQSNFFSPKGKKTQTFSVSDKKNHNLFYKDNILETKGLLFQVFHLKQISNLIKFLWYHTVRHFQPPNIMLKTKWNSRTKYVRLTSLINEIKKYLNNWWVFHYWKPGS